MDVQPLCGDSLCTNVTEKQWSSTVSEFKSHQITLPFSFSDGCGLQSSLLQPGLQGPAGCSGNSCVWSHNMFYRQLEPLKEHVTNLETDKATVKE